MRSLFAAFLISACAYAQPAPKVERNHAITIDDFATLATITELAISSDGKQVAYCEARWDKAEDNRRADLWVVSTDGNGKPRRLTGDRANERQPRWSADGKAIYVVANRKRAGETKAPHDGTAQVWSIPIDGGEPRAITRVPGGITGFDFAPTADAVFYSVDAPATDADEFTRLREKFAKPEYGHGQRKTSEVYRLDLRTWRTEKIVAESRYVREFAVTRDGARLAMITAPDDTVIASEGKSRVDIWDATTGKVVIADESWRKTAASPWPWLEHLAWGPDGKRLAFCSNFDAHPAEIIVQEFNDKKWKARQIERPKSVMVNGYGSPLKWDTTDSPDARLYFLCDFQGQVLQLADPEGGHVEFNLEESDRQIITNFDIAPLAAIGVQFGATSTQLAELVSRTRAEGGVAQHQLTDLNPRSKSWKLPSVKHITWKAPDGTEVGGVLELPFGYKKGDKLPLVVGLHGGPTTASHTELTYDAHNGRLYFAAHGYAAFFPNYRGSTGYGDKFVTDLIGNENDIEVKDILAGIQQLIKDGIADPERVGVMGWSNGGYLTNCLISLKNSPVRFKAASSGAGIVDTVAEWGFNDEPAYPTVFKKGLPWETPDIYRKTSPTYSLGNVTTPTLIHVGGNDERCPPGHSRMLYRALREYNKVPTELVVYPGEPHGLTKLSNRLAKMEWDLAWFGKYLGK